MSKLELDIAGGLLVIGYGNTLRRDDGVGPKIAEAIAGQNLPGVRSIAVTQLTPELAEPVAKSRVVVFVDAAMDAPQEVRLRRLTPNKAHQFSAHAVGPGTLLALARDLYGCDPLAWWLTIPAQDLGYGEGLSELTESGFSIALERIQALACESLNTWG